MLKSRPLLLTAIFALSLFTCTAPAHADAPATVKVCSSSPQIFGILANTINPPCNAPGLFSSTWHLSNQVIDTSTLTMNVCMSSDPTVRYFNVQSTCRYWQKAYTYSRKANSSVPPTLGLITPGITTTDIALSDIHWNSDAPVKLFTVKAIKADSATNTPLIQSLPAATTASGVELPQVLHVTGLLPSTRYTFTVSATSVDGTTNDSPPSTTITTQDPLPAAPEITLSSGSENVFATTPLVGYTITNSGGPIDHFTISPPLPDGIGLSFDPTTGLIAGTPNGEIPTTPYSITAVNAGGTSTAIFTLTVTPIIAGPTATTVGTLLLLTFAWALFVLIQRRRFARSR